MPSAYHARAEGLGILQRAAEEGRDPTAEEVAIAKNYLADAKTLSEVDKLSKQLGPGSLTAGDFAGFGDGPGDSFIQSEQYKRYQASRPGPESNWTTGPVPVQFKSGPFSYQMKAGTLLESAQGAGLVPVPQVIPGVVEKQFEPISVLNLIPSSPATTSHIRYTVEGTATNMAAGVAEGAEKPESDLALSTVDEKCMKVATVVSLSDELFDDAPQVQQYLNSRLALFVRLEFEQQVLRGAGAGSNELLGLFGRGINTYGIGGDSPLVGIYKALVKTRGSSNLAPSGIVMHPVNYANIRRGTTTTGEFIGGPPIGSIAPAAGIYQDNLWGVPVALSTHVGLGTALLGAFNTASHLYSRGGPTVEMSNSHASYFRHNMLMVRAEQRAALACFRPNAFTAVTGLGTAI
jgi:HK97 family phage major capsid protein